MNSIKKYFHDYWYYYKFYAIVALILIAIATYACVLTFSSEKYDYRVVLYLSQGITSEVEDAVATSVEQYGEDTDGNGKIAVQIINISYSPYEESDSSALGHATTLAGELKTDKSFIFITDEYRFDELDKLGVFEKQKFLNDCDGKAYAAAGSAFESNIKKELKAAQLDSSRLPQLLLSIRRAPDKNEKAYDTYTNSLKLLKAIVQEVE